MTGQIKPRHDIQEINVHCRKNAKEIYSKYMISDRERKTIIAELGDPACMLYEFYLRMASHGNVPLTDENASEYFGWKPSKVRTYRNALTNAGWFRQVRGTYADGRRSMTYYIGEEAVRESKIGITE